MNKTNEVKQMQVNELTMFQQIAVEAEVMSIMGDCDEEDEYELKYSAFLKLALCNEKYLLVYKNEFMKYLDEEVVNELVGYRYTGIVPIYLFIHKYLNELRSMVGLDCGSLRLFSMPKKVIQSKFIVAMRELLTYIPNTASALLDGLVAQGGEELEFLYPIIFALKQEVEDSIVEKNVGYDVKLKLLSTPLNMAPILNIQVEDERLLKMIKNEGMSYEERIKELTKELLMDIRDIEKM